MKDHQNDIWIGAADKANPEAFFANASEEFAAAHFAETLSKADDAGFAPNRRDFLKLMGFSLGAATVAAGCEIPVRKAIPYVSKPDEIVPGVANYFASSFVNGGDYAPVLVKTREGRPIKMEGNTLSSITRGGTSARAQASVLSLYDTHRTQSAGKVVDGKVEKMEWSVLDREVKSKLGGNTVIFAGTILSPTAKMALANFVQKYPNTRIAQLDPVSSSALLTATKKVFPLVEGVPNYDFSNAETIVSFGADFLGTWVSPIEFARQYAANRRVTDLKAPKMSRHYQVESFMSMTGSNADHRVIIRPSEMGAAIASLYNELGGGLAGAPALKSEKAAKAIKKLAAELKAKAGKSIIVCGSNNEAEQILCLRMNAMLGNIGASVSTNNAFQTRQGNELSVQNAIREMAAGQIQTAIVWGCNPAYEIADSAAFSAAFAKVGTRVSLNSTMDETTALCSHVAPTSHGLESWGDAEPKMGFLSLQQPTIAPLFLTRQAEESLLAWADQPATAYDFMKSVWEKEYFPKQTKYATFQAFWDMALHDGVLEMPVRDIASAVPTSPEVSGSQLSQPSNSEVEIQFFETVNVGGGQYSNNPWLMEMPDPVTRVSWDNVLMIPAGFDGVNHMTGFKDLVDGDKVTLKVNGKEATVVVARAFGMAENTVALAVGYGREKGGAGSGYGTNANQFLTQKNGLTQYFGDAEVSGKTGLDKEFACVQYHHTMGVKAIGKEENAVINADEKSLGYKGFQGSLTDRSVIFQANLPDLTAKTKEPGEKHPMNFVERLQEKRKDYQFLNDQTIYGGHEREYSKGLHWGMHVDLNACTGCGACTVACMSENNVPVVGKKEVSRHHEMTWLRIDRYYYGDIENPSVVYQPMMCQHCDNAPCENVCPVAATSHSMEGLNQMTYNRCIGTRYCANNCPFKVRRFNWLDYTTADLWPSNEYSMFKGGADKDVPFYADNLVRMVMNPDVTVRSRGVIEKCSFCVQRIQEGKLTAKREARALADNDVRTACQTACPTEAITFGNFRNPESAIAKKRRNELNYIVLEEVNVAPNVQYTARITNKDESLFS